MTNSKGIPDFSKIKESVSFEEVLKHYGLLDSFKRKGDQLTGSCPIHKGDGKSCFSVNLQKGCFNCFSCKSHGNILDFVAVMEEVELKEAGILLSDWFNIPLQPGRVERHTNQGGKSKEKALVREKKNDDLAGSAELVNPPLTFELKNLDQAHPYLKERGLTPEAIKFFGLGYCSKGLQKGRIVIPIHNEHGELVAYSGRWPGDDFPKEEGKYKLPPKFLKSHIVFNLHRAKESLKDHGLILVEGFFSVFRLWQIGFPHSAALMGSTLSEQQEELIVSALGPGGRVILLFDNDQAGKACEEDCLRRLSIRCFVKVSLLPPGQDLDRMEEAEIKALLL